MNTSPVTIGNNSPLAIGSASSLAVANTSRPAFDATSASAIEVSELTRRYALAGRRRDAVTAVDSVSFALPSASFTALVGPSGCGKSTLLQCVAGLDRPTSGSVRMLGTETTGLSARQAARWRARHIGFVFQDDNLVSSLSAQDNVALPGRLRRRPLKRAEVRTALERVGLEHHARHLPHQMSGGERQRVAIARVLASRPDIVFADEPTAALDVAAGTQVLDWFSELVEAGTTVVMVTHDPTAAARAKRVLVMGSGRIAGELDGGDAAAVSRAVLESRSVVDAGVCTGGALRPDGAFGPGTVRVPGAVLDIGTIQDFDGDDVIVERAAPDKAGARQARAVAPGTVGASGTVARSGTVGAPGTVPRAGATASSRTLRKEGK